MPEEQLALFGADVIPPPIFSSRADQIERTAEEYVTANPHIWRHFVRFARQASRHRAHYSARAIFHRIRWHLEVEVEGDAEFKINNNFSAVFARWFHRTHPQHAGFFHLRERVSEKGAPRADADRPCDSVEGRR